MEATDESLVARCRAGDTEAFAVLVDRYRRRIFSLVLRMVGNWDDAQDLAQEAFVRAYQGLHTFDGRQRFSPWLYRIAVNHCISALRRKRPLTAPLEVEEDGELREVPLPDSSFDPARCWLQAEERRELHQAILALPEKYRAAILLYHVEELSYEEMAQVLDLPINTVRTHLHRARALLRRMLEPVLEDT